MSIMTGAPSPIHVRNHATVAYGDKIILMGGYKGSSCSNAIGYTKEIYEYDSWNNTWTKLDFELPYNTYFGSAMFVDDNICNI